MPSKNPAYVVVCCICKRKNHFAMLYMISHPIVSCWQCGRDISRERDHLLESLPLAPAE